MRKIILVLFSLLFPCFLMAKQIFTEEAFRQAQKDNEAILVDIHASWCPTCKRQTAIIQEYLKKHPSSKLKVMTIDFDEQKEWVKYFKAPRQSTLILFKGQSRVWFSVAETKSDVIFQKIQSVEGF